MSSSKVVKNDEDVRPFVLKTIKKSRQPVDRLAAIERDAYEKGFAAGEKAGFEFGRQKADAIFRSLAQIVEELEGFRERLLTETEKDVVRLSLAIARKVIDLELSVREDIVLNAVKTAIEFTGKATNVVVRLNKDDMETIKKYVPELEQYSVEAKKIVLREDPSVSRGGCIVETENATIEHTIEGALREIEERLKDVYGKAEENPE